MTDTNDQPGACAPVPLPEPEPEPEPAAWYVSVPEKDDGYYVETLDDAQAIDDMTNHRAEVAELHTADQLRAYGEACAAQRNAELAKLCEDRTRMLQQAERERDEQRARAEAAEAKLKSITDKHGE